MADKNKTDLNNITWKSWKKTIRFFSSPLEKSGEDSPDSFMITGEPFLDQNPEDDLSNQIEWLRGKSVSDGTDFLFLRADLHRIHPDNNQETGNLIPGTEIVNRWWGLRSEYEPDDLVEIPSDYCIQDGRKYLYRKATLPFLLKMIDAAKGDGVIIKVNSSYRSFDYQAGLYDKAHAKDGLAQRYSAPPGHSEHQLGTCVDLTDPEEVYAFTEEFDETEQGQWLAKRSHEFGFRRSYTQQNKAETGYISEPWHWRYIGNS